jgi:isoleucyl-tRNA synthetase
MPGKKLPERVRYPRCLVRTGSSAEAVLGTRDDLPWPADVYIEGGDQYRGWFPQPLLLGVGVDLAGRPIARC